MQNGSTWNLPTTQTPQENAVNKLEPGKRYTMTLQVQANRNDTVAAINPARYIAGVPDLIEAGATFEPLPDPLPTTPGSVIRTSGTPCTYVKLREPSLEGSWINEYGVRRGDDNLTVMGFTVLFDAGADRG
jgi:hypothetical protein